MTPRSKTSNRHPSFLVIGAQKAGTTWLFKHLQQHPEIWLPPSKEIHYFDDLWPDSFLLDLLARVYRSNTSNPEIDFDRMMWFANFALKRPRTDAWYASLFKPAGDRIAGDITPAYSMLDEEKVAHVHSLMPEAKVIFIMRNPVDRIWSQFRFSESWKVKGIPEQDVSDDYIISEMDTEPYDLRTRYCRTISNWETHYDPEQMLYLFFEDIAEKPFHLLDKVAQKLDIDPLSSTISTNVSEKYNETQSGLQRRKSVDAFFAKKYIKDITELSERFGGVTLDWLKKAETLANT